MKEQQVVFVTGASSGFGRLTAQSLARQGYTVFAGIRQSHGKNAAARVEIQTLAETERLALEVLDVDVTEEASVEQAVKQVIEQVGRLDVVVNNAGIAVSGPIEALTLEQVQQQFDTNVFGALRVNRAALPQMRKQGSGLLIQIGSVMGRLAFPFAGVYSATKFALEGLTEAYRQELAALGIDAVIVEPGTYPTDFLKKIGGPTDIERVGPYSAFLEQFTTMMMNPSPQGEPDPQEVADAIAQVIATSAGQRPLRTVVAIESQRQGTQVLNGVSEQVIQATKQALGWESFTTLRRAESVELQ